MSNDTLGENLAPPSLLANDREFKHKEFRDSRASSDMGLILVDWEGPDDPMNPKNWSYKRKWAATFIVSAFSFISPVSSSMVAPAANKVAQDFGVSSTVITAMMTSVFLLGFAVGPLFLGPLSEIYGRSRVLQLSNLFFLVWNIACGFSRNQGEFIALRFLSGLGGSAPLAIGGGVLGDTWDPEERGKAMAIYSLAPLLGPVFGPICGAWIAERSTWRWVFWSSSIVDVAVQVAGLFFLQETFAPFLLEQKASKIRQTMDIEKGDLSHVRTVFEEHETRHWKRIFSRSLIRPFLIFAQEPIIQLLGIYMAFVYGNFYLFLTTIPGIFENVYHETTSIGGLHYISLGIGLILTSQINANFMDRIYLHFKTKNNDIGEPEFRLPSMMVGTMILPIGLLLAGWSAQNRIHWVVTDIGIAMVGSGMVLNFQSIQTYTVDAFTLYSASALAAVSCLRSLAGFGFPLFAPVMYETLGYGKGNTILAAVAIGIGCPAPWLFWCYGKRVRTSSKHARKP